MLHVWNARQRALVAMCAWAAVSVACAVSVPPSGGPEDKLAPTITASVPAPDSTGVDPRSDIRLEFSEPMERQRVERLVSVAPAIEIDRVSWEGNTLVIHPTHELVRDTTYVVRVKPDYQDRHGVGAAQWHEFAFATGSAPLDTARIEGTVTLKRAPAVGAIVRCWRLLPGDTLNLDRDKPDREATANRTGEFKLRYLPANGSRFIVMAFSDQNSNRVYDADTDPGAIYPDTVVVIPALPVVGAVDIGLIDPREPGKVSGTVANESGVDTSRVMVAMYDEADTTRAAYRAVCDSSGAYRIDPVKPGS
ncbi:MAG TPA: Ig-like domain-containing protein, partial [Candidatus Krumholzibacteria bacterium]